MWIYGQIKRTFVLNTTDCTISDTSIHIKCLDLRFEKDRKKATLLISGNSSLAPGMTLWRCSDVHDLSTGSKFLEVKISEGDVHYINIFFGEELYCYITIFLIPRKSTPTFGKPLSNAPVMCTTEVLKYIPRNISIFF